MWIRPGKGDLYPNLYVIFCAPPGIGKTEMIWRVRDMWESLETHHVANSSLTKASLIDSLDDAQRNIVHPQLEKPTSSFNSLLVASNELGVLLPQYDNEFMNALQDIYDGKGYSESRRTSKLKIHIKHPNLNILAGCTPGYLRETLPPGAWDQGFISRSIIVYSGEQELGSLWLEGSLDEKLEDVLKSQLKEIGELYGKISFTQEAKDFIDAWHLGGQEPKPVHPRLMHYNIRRTAHILKLSTVACVSAGGFPTITKEHIQTALDWLIEAEVYMPDIFKAMSSGGDSQVIEDTWHFVWETYIKEGKKPIGLNRVIYFLQERTSAHNVLRVLEVMMRSEMLQKTLAKGIGEAVIPTPRQPR